MAYLDLLWAHSVVHPSIFFSSQSETVCNYNQFTEIMWVLKRNIYKFSFDCFEIQHSFLKFLFAEVYKENETHKILLTAKFGAPGKCVHMCGEFPNRPGFKQIWNTN